MKPSRLARALWLTARPPVHLRLFSSSPSTAFRSRPADPPGSSLPPIPDPTLRPLPPPIKLYPVSPSLTVPRSIPHPPYALPTFFSDPRRSQHSSSRIERKSPSSIAAMRTAALYAAYIRHFASLQLHPGRTTDEVDRLVHEECIRLQVYPSPLGYAGFPKSLCTSINQVVCHGIPDGRPMEKGDLINLDVSCYVEGHHGDCSGTWIVGGPTEADTHALHLIAAVREAVKGSIAVCGPGVPFHMIGEVCQRVADRCGYSIVKEFCGHGIGREFHQPPVIFHHRHEGGEVMQPGMTFTIEPMMNEGGSAVRQREDGWTIETVDGYRSAQWEETILITPQGVEVLTTFDPSSSPPPPYTSPNR